jgi:Fe-S-cluster containining protein
MRSVIQIEDGDRRLLAQIAEAMAEAARRSGAWLACRPGCTQCCIGPFAITALDAWRLRRGLAELEMTDPDRAKRVRERAASYVEAMAPFYPGDPVSGELQDEDALPASMDSVACPALDPDTGLCDLYDARPITCRTFGPVTRVGEEDFGACELCYQGVSDEEKIRCAVEVDPEGLECALLATLAEGGAGGMTIVAYALMSGLWGREETTSATRA